MIFDQRLKGGEGKVGTIRLSWRRVSQVEGTPNAKALRPRINSTQANVDGIEGMMERVIGKGGRPEKQWDQISGP